jgi:hypothetical protein
MRLPNIKYHFKNLFLTKKNSYMDHQIEVPINQSKREEEHHA